MQLSRFLSTTSAAAIAFANIAAGCNGDECGTGGAPVSGLVVSNAEVTLTYGNLTALVGNDCPDNNAPSGVVSVSLEGTQTDGSGLITICIPRPDLMNAGDRTMDGPTSTADIRIIDLQGSANTCTYRRDGTRPTSGTGTGSGVCGNGDDPAGWALTLDGALGLRRTCGTDITVIDVTIAGTVAVTKRS
jgi:hypothetical protein